jgi:hypothetical protein
MVIVMMDGQISATQAVRTNGKDGKPAGYVVWSAYVLQKAGAAWKVVLLDWSVRRLDAAE